MKKLIGLVLIFVLLFLGTYLGFGLLARKNYDAALAELEANFPGQLESRYSQGLFSSQFNVLFELPVPGEDPANQEKISARIEQTVHHGPFIFNAEQKKSPLYVPLQLYSQGTMTLEPFMAGEPAFVSELRKLATTDITVHAPLTGRTDVTFTGRPLQSTLAVGSENFDLNWQGFTGLLSLEGNNFLTYDLDFHAPGLNLKGQGPEGLAVTGITTQARMKEGIHKLSLGTISSSMEDFQLVLGNNPEDNVSIAGLNLRIANSEANGLIDLEEEVSLEEIRFSDKTYGPAALQINLSKLDAQAVAKISEAFKEVQTNPAQAETMALGLLSSQATALLAKSPEITLKNFSLASPEGACRSSAHIVFNGDGEVILNPIFLLGRLSAEADFSADESFLAMQTKNFIKTDLCAERSDPACDQEAALQGSRQLQSLVDRNVLVLENGKYTLTASFKDGQSTLNGQPVPLSF